MLRQQRPLKNSLIGFELELFTINNNGHIINAADRLLNKAKISNHAATIKKECASNIIEIACYPGKDVPNAMDKLLGELEYLISIAEKEGILLLPLGCYPGKFNPDMRDDKTYKIKKYIFGYNKFKIAGRCTGFHCHYTLPKGIFDTQLRVIKVITRSKIKDSLVNSYNLLIAADPALTTFMQSSPFYQGRFIGKDSRIIMYRGGEHLNNASGLYSNFPEFGGLPSYKLTTFDIMDILATRFERWKSYIKSLGLNVRVLSLYGSILDTVWGPVKINPNGTLEQRGMDMNHPTYIACAGTIIKFVLKKLQEEYYTVVPSEIGIKEPFKVEGGVIYIPPYSFVRTELQKLSAYEGFESELVFRYCKNFLRFAESTMPRNQLALIDPIRQMIKRKKTISDEILDTARKKGFKKESITNKLSAEIAYEHAARLLIEVISIRKNIEKFE